MDDDFRKRKRRSFEWSEGFGDEFFTGIGEDFHRRIHEQMDRLMREAVSNFENLDFEPGKNIVYGFSMQTGPDGKPVIEEFGNVPRPGEEQIPGEREPLVDVIDGKDDVTVIAELPGVNKEDIDLKTDDKTLSVHVEKGDHRYHKELRMPAEVDPDSIKASYKNGVLEVKLRRREKKAEAKKKIKVE
jgi:HSP20 family protein